MAICKWRIDFAVCVMRIGYEVMFRFLGSAAIAAMAISCAAPTSQRDAGAPVPLSPAPLARFMRESVGVPFSFVMFETGTAQRERRVHRAAVMLRAAAIDLAHWSDPPAASEEGREVFFTYASNLERHVARLEDAAARRETDVAVDSVEQIRQTCNHCHRFFRPTNMISSDVAYDWYALDLGGF